MTIEGAVPSNAPALVVRTQGSDRRLQAGPAYKIGRDPASDIVVDDSRVSWCHAMLRIEHDCWLLEDSGSTNGTFLDSRRVQRVPIAGACTLRLGHPADGAAVTCLVVLAESAAAGPAAGPMGTAIVATPPPVQQDGWAARSPAPPARQDGWPPRSPAPPARQDGQPPRSPAAPAQQPGWPPQGYPTPAPAPASSIVRQPSAIMRLPTKVLRIGRASDNDVVVSDLSVSRYHAELRKTGRGYEIVDLASHNGTFVNGQWVTTAPVTERDIISIGPATFRLVGDELQEFIDTGDISLAARDLTVRLSGGKVLLDHVSFPLGERCLLGVIGPSGAGKSTLLGALTGGRPATEGSVLYDNRDLYTYYAELRHRIGLVPQDNILHTQLSARRALGYAAELRFPRDTSKTERKRRIDEVLQELSLTKHADTRTAAMSGGQQKRVNVALELLTKPSLLFLDEPTSGLDPGLDKSVMEMMAELAHDGRTIIVVTHSVANLNLCDRLLVLVPGGKVAYFGPPEEGLRYFGKPGWAEVFQAFEAEPNRDWAGEFRRSPAHDRYITAEMSNVAPATAPVRPAAPPPATRNRLAQLSTLCRRYLAVIASSRVYLAMLAVTPIVLAGAIRLMPAPDGLAGGPGTNADAQGLLLILVMSACFTGAFLSVGEIVKERSIFARERAAGLSTGVYLWSKLLVLGFISAVQAVLLVLLGLAGRPLPPTGALLKSAPLAELLIATGFLALTSMALGLLFSSITNSPEKTMPLLLVAVVVQIILSGGVFVVNGKVGAEQLAWVAPSRWGFAATAATSNYNVIVPGVGVSAAAVTSPSPGTPPASGKAVTARQTATSANAHAPGKDAAPARTAASAKASLTARTSSTARTSGAATPPAPKPDPLWNHTPRAWLTDIGALALLGIVFCFLTWRRLIRMSPGRR